MEDTTMARKIENNLTKEELLKQINIVGETATTITSLIDNNWGRDPVMYRRARTITEKIQELKKFIEEK